MHEYNRVINKCRKVITSCVNKKQLLVSTTYCTLLVDTWYKRLVPSTYDERQDYNSVRFTIKDWLITETDIKRKILSAKG